MQNEIVHRKRSTVRPRTRILVDGGDPEETRAIKDLLGFVDGQTTNPSLIAKNPEIVDLLHAGHKLTEQQEADEYRKIVRAIPPLVGDAGVSIEVFGDLKTTAEHMYEQGRDMFSWIPNAYVKYPCTSEGLKAAERSVREGIRVNMTLCFSQEQAAAAYGATRGATASAYVSTVCWQPWERFNIEHELTRKGVEKFAADYRATLYPKAS